eukprot:scaffold2308_cov164-Ochromonas_danica.AAC.10
MSFSLEEIDAIKNKVRASGFDIPHIQDDLTWKLLLDDKVLTKIEFAKIRAAILSAATPALQPQEGKCFSSLSSSIASSSTYTFQFHFLVLPFTPTGVAGGVDNAIEGLYTPSEAPSSIEKEAIDAHQRGHTMFSPCSNSFVVVATCLAYEQIAAQQDARMIKLGEMVVDDVNAALNNQHSMGYCSQKKMKEEGITALLTSNLEKCYNHYCSQQKPSLLPLQNEKTYFMHQCATTEAIKGNVDIGVFYKFEETDSSFFVKGRRVIYPMGFFEFTKTSTKQIPDKLPQASLYANALFRTMKFAEMKTWVPLLGVVMSESEFVVKLYSLTIVDEKKWKIAEIDILKSNLNSASVIQLIHMMAGWVAYCANFLTSELAKARFRGAINENLRLRHTNVAIIGQEVFECFDYRVISDRCRTEEVLRDPQWYQLGDLNVECVVDWSNPINSSDCLKIIKYPFVEGTHQPIHVKHLAMVMQKLLDMHSKNVVHGDLRYANIVFSKVNTSPLYSKLIDFDYSGVDGEAAYPTRFNLDIPDGKRHPEALPGELLHKEHDVYSFKWMCSQYRPKSIDHQASWQEWIDSEDSDLTQGVKIFERIGDEELECVVPTLNKLLCDR